jgi:hypothetical protein
LGWNSHPDNPRLIEFGRYAAERRGKRGLGKPETFDFFGFTHMCEKPKKGRFWVRRVTISKRMRAKLAEASTTSSSDVGTGPFRSKGSGLPAWCEDTATTTPCPATPTR